MKVLIPQSPDSLTPAWLTGVLQRKSVLIDCIVKKAILEPVCSQGWTTQVIRIRLTYDKPGCSAPASVIAKLSSKDSATRSFFGRFYAREVAFFRYVALEAPIRVPYCYAFYYDELTQAHVLLLEDLAPSQAGSIIQGVGVDDAACYARQIAVFHAHWWESEALCTLARYFPPYNLASAGHYAEYLDRGLSIISPYINISSSWLASRIESCLQALQEMQTTAPQTLIHWDAHAGNVLSPSKDGGEWAVVDWQYCSLGHGIWDVARFCVLSLRVVDRRETERDIMDIYTKALVAYGVKGYSFSMCLKGYQEAMLLQLPQQLDLYAKMKRWDATRRAWVAVMAPRLVAAFLDAAREYHI